MYQLINSMSLLLISIILLKNTAEAIFCQDFFLLVSLSAFIGKFLLAGGILALIALLHLFHPKVPIPEEVEEEIDWYNWEQESR